VKRFRPAPIGTLVSVRIYDSIIEIRDRRTQALLRTQGSSLALSRAIFQMLSYLSVQTVLDHSPLSSDGIVGI
jgi:hypothetical protein